MIYIDKAIMMSEIAVVSFAVMCLIVLIVGKLR